MSTAAIDAIKLVLKAKQASDNRQSAQLTRSTGNDVALKETVITRMAGSKLFSGGETPAFVIRHFQYANRYAQ
jgi:hypothetical protein